MFPIQASVILTVVSPPIHAGILPDEPPAVLDLDGDSVVDLIIPGGNVEIDVIPQESNRTLAFDEFGTPYAANLADGSLIGAAAGDGMVWGLEPSVMSSCFNIGGVVCGGNYLGGIGYMGVEFDIGGLTHYGWIEIESREFIPWVDVHRWAYQSEPGVPIRAGQVPEPSTVVLLLASLAIGMSRWR